MGADVEKVIDRVGDRQDFTDIVGGHGPWQRVIFYVFFLVYIPSAWHNLAMTFLAPNINHWCARPEVFLESNISIETWKKMALPKDDSVKGGDGYSQCYRYGISNLTNVEELQNFTQPFFRNKTAFPLKDNSSALIPCQKWEYDSSMYINTVVSQWDLVCDREWLISLTKSIFMAGFLTSMLTFGQIADKIGRKPVLMICAFIFLASGVICACSLSFIMFAVARFFVALGISGMLNTGFVILMEAVSSEYRSEFGIAVNFGWSLGFAVLPGLSWLVRDWVFLQLALTLPWITFIALWWLIPESPRWLLAQGKVDKAEEILCQIAKSNGKKLPDVEPALKKLCAKAAKMRKDEENNGGNLIDLLRTPGLWQKTINIFFNWLVNAFIYYGLSYNTNELAGDPFINFAVFGITEIPAYVISIFIIRRLGRRLPLMTIMVVGGLTCLAILLVPDNYIWVRVSLAMFGKFCITASFGIIYVYSAEIFPTVARNTGIGTGSMFARFGSIIAPFVKELEHATHSSFPFICYGVLSIISGLLVLFLPETNKRKVPDTILEAAGLGREEKPKESKEEAYKVHEENGISKTSTSVLKSTMDSKKLPNVVEEPSVFEDEDDEDDKNNDNTEEVETTNDITENKIETLPTFSDNKEHLETVAEEISPVVVENSQDTAESTVEEITEVDENCSQQTPL